MRTLFAVWIALVLLAGSAAAQRAESFYLVLQDQEVLVAVDLASVTGSELRQAHAVFASRSRGEVIHATMEFSCAARQTRRTLVSVYGLNGEQRDSYVPEDQSWRDSRIGSVGGDILDLVCGFAQPRPSLLLSDGEGAARAFLGGR